jgi:hypothetical protein
LHCVLLLMNSLLGIVPACADASPAQALQYVSQTNWRPVTITPWLPQTQQQRTSPPILAAIFVRLTLHCGAVADKPSAFGVVSVCADSSQAQAPMTMAAADTAATHANFITMPAVVTLLLLLLLLLLQIPHERKRQ